MEIQKLKVNHRINPVGYSMDKMFLQWQVNAAAGTHTQAARVHISTEKDMENTVFDSGKLTTRKNNYAVTMKLQPGTRYYWNVWVEDDSGDSAISETAYFETAPYAAAWSAKWIGTGLAGDGEVFQRIIIEKEVTEARLYVAGAGLYEAYLDGEKVGDEYLTPNFNNYDAWMQVQTYCLLGAELMPGEHELRFLLGSGWYKGRYMSMGPGNDRNRYGTETAVLAELYISYADGSTQVISTDETWQGCEGKIRENSLYDGEVIDDTFSEVSTDVLVHDFGYEKLTGRLSPPVKVMQERKPSQLIHTDKGEVILDFGQNMVGWVCFYNRLAQGQKGCLQFGEILQDGSFYRDNLRSAKAQFSYISAGESKWIRPHFTYYGFRYVKLSGFGEDVCPEDFTAQVLYSDMEQTGMIETDNKEVNQLISNILWGQRGNFLDVPTDCPQRDERLGWTGDAQVFSMTAAYNMDVAAFFKKYLYDMYTEQQKMDGGVPFIVPNICFGNQVSAAWRDAAVIIPWNMYLMYGDAAMLMEQYEGMKAWIEYVLSRDEAGGGTRLWTSDAHFGDWLALDSPDAGLPIGGTDMVMIATAYYYLSVRLTRKAAAVLKREEDVLRYQTLEKEIREAFLREFFTSTGRLAVDTQTAYALVLYTGLYQEGQQKRLIDGLVNQLKKNGYRLNTGFVGTPFLCQMLSKYGRNDLAYHLLLNEEYPGWLYCVKLGATTIWERWNSVMPDGHMNPEGMNSLNHYAYGAIQEWMYRCMLGIQPLEEYPGFEKFILAPQPNRRLKWVGGSFKSSQGEICSSWKYEENGKLIYHFEIPFGSEAYVILDDCDGREVYLNDRILEKKQYDERKKKTSFRLMSGKHEVAYVPRSFGSRNYSKDTQTSIILQDEAARDVIARYAPELVFTPKEFLKGSLEEDLVNVFSNYSYLDLERIIGEIK